jgi:hypothetical protein
MMYSGPVWENGAWRHEAFPVVVRPLVFLPDCLTIVSVVETEMAAAAQLPLNYSTDPFD